MDYRDEITPDDLLDNETWVHTARKQAIENGCDNDHDIRDAVNEMAQNDAETYNQHRRDGIA